MSLACIMTSGVYPGGQSEAVPRARISTREEALAELAKLPAKQQKAIMEQAQALRVQRGHEKRFTHWQDQLKTYIRAERGRTSELARYLGVRRQSLWRWINEPYSKFPAWAAVATIVWYFRVVSPQADNLVRGSADKLLQLVSPQTDNERRAA